MSYKSKQKKNGCYEPGSIKELEYIALRDAFNKIKQDYEQECKYSKKLANELEVKKDDCQLLQLILIEAVNTIQSHSNMSYDCIYEILREVALKKHPPKSRDDLKEIIIQ